MNISRPDRPRGKDWRQWLRDAVQVNVGRAILLAFGLVVVVVSYLQVAKPSSTISLVAGATMVGVACILPWVAKGKVGPGGVEFETRNLAELSALLSMESRDTAAAQLERTPADEEATAAVRLLVADFAIGRLLTRNYGPLGGVEFHLFMYDEPSGRLVPIFEPREDASRGWAAGQGATGQCYLTGEYVLVRGAAVSDGTYDLTQQQQEQYRNLAIVAAMPVLNARGEVIAVLSGSSEDADSPLGSPDGYAEHVALADAMARILVDLLKWADD